MSKTTTTAPVVATAPVSDNHEERIRDAYQALQHVLLLHIVDNKLPEPTFKKDFAQCGPEDYKAMHIMANGMIRAKDEGREAARVAPLLTGLRGLQQTYNDAQRAKKARYDAIPAQDREFLAPFPTSFSIPLAEVAKVWPSGTPATTVARDLMSDALKKALSYKVVDSGAMVFTFFPEPVKRTSEEFKAAFRAPEVQAQIDADKATKAA